MKLTELLNFDDIAVQCHNNPDADAIASGWGVVRWLEHQGKKARLVYGGTAEIQKANLVLMVKALNIPIEHVNGFPEPPRLLVCVDGQYGDTVEKFSDGNEYTVAVIDHHKVGRGELPELHEVREDYGSCATIVWDMLKEAGFDPAEDEDLATALYYGLFMDTAKLQELRHVKDMDARDALMFRCRKSLMFQLQNCNISKEELEIAGRALSACEYCPEQRFAITCAEPCDPNILGIIADMMMETDAIDVCVAFCMIDGGTKAKMSVRSCVREVQANEFAAYLAEGVGGGGGHARKAGGTLIGKLLFPDGCDAPEEAVQRRLVERMETYFREQVLLYAGSEQVPDLSGEPLYRKKRLPIGYVKGTDLYPAGTRVTVRMLEGDIGFTVEEDTYFMIGVEAEVYRNTAKYFFEHNDLSEEPYRFEGKYAPNVRTAVKPQQETPGEPPKLLTDYARTCIPRKGPLAHARKIDRRTKVFTTWSEEYMLGLPGDWLVARAEDPGDIYIVKADIFDKSYERV